MRIRDLITILMGMAIMFGLALGIVSATDHEAYGASAPPADYYVNGHSPTFVSQETLELQYNGQTGVVYIPGYTPRFTQFKAGVVQDTVSAQPKVAGVQYVPGYSPSFTQFKKD